MPQLEGRVFSRKLQFLALPSELQEETKALEAHLTTHKDEVFALHHANLVKSILSVRGRPLLEKIEAWLKETKPESEAVGAASAAATTTTTADAPATTEATPPTAAAPETATTTDATSTSTQEATSVDAATAAATPAPAALTPTPTPTPAATHSTASTRHAHAKRLVEALVLDGFLTPHKEHDKAPSPTHAPQLRENELFVPVAAEVAEVASTVWTVADGATFAGHLKRKAGFLAPLTQGKDVYVVVNERLQSLSLFESDVGRALVHAFAAGAFVSFDKSHFVHGVQVRDDKVTMLFNAATKVEQEAFVSALVAAGMQYREDFALDLEQIKSLYDLQDVDMDGNAVPMSMYRGKVVLAVNVSSECGLTPINYPELVQLDDKYRDQGLVVLAFPCNQFGAQEPGTHEQIREFVKQYNAQFQFFEKRDVNGFESRPVFTYLKVKLPGAFGNYVKWNFTKFLVDRNGQPIKRFAPNESPMSFEDEIIALLHAEALPEVVLDEAAKVGPDDLHPAVETAAAPPAEDDQEKVHIEEPRFEQEIVNHDAVADATTESAPVAAAASEETPATAASPEQKPSRMGSFTKKIGDAITKPLSKMKFKDDSKKESTQTTLVVEDPQQVQQEQEPLQQKQPTDEAAAPTSKVDDLSEEEPGRVVDGFEAPKAVAP